MLPERDVPTIYIPRRRSSLFRGFTFCQCINIETHDHVSLFCYCIISLCSLCMDGIIDTSPSVVANLVNG